MTICLVDTSIFCNILEVPGRCQDKQRVVDELEQKIGEESNLLLPLAAIVETGNHIAHCTNGGARRKVAKRFVKQVRMAIEGTAPWVVTPLPGKSDWLTWLEEFPDTAMRGVGIGDLSILKAFEQQCRLHPMRRVMIWSLDVALDGYDRAPRRT
ncbi:MAG: hypothetical protein DSZ00_01695 [Gammaproteobacteria bacterium]|nr:MAG: hypothetical protein DSZ00_01695 [Gammaproteobacteria bacterium]